MCVQYMCVCVWVGGWVCGVVTNNQANGQKWHESLFFVFRHWAEWSLSQMMLSHAEAHFKFNTSDPHQAVLLLWRISLHGKIGEVVEPEWEVRRGGGCCAAVALVQPSLLVHSGWCSNHPGQQGRQKFHQQGPLELVELKPWQSLILCWSSCSYFHHLG